MPKFRCACGYVINLSDGATGNELLLVREDDVDRIGFALSTTGLSEEGLYDVLSEAITVYRCPNCSRLHLEGKDGVFSSYVREVRSDQ